MSLLTVKSLNLGSQSWLLDTVINLGPASLVFHIFADTAVRLNGLSVVAFSNTLTAAVSLVSWWASWGDKWSLVEGVVTVFNLFTGKGLSVGGFASGQGWEEVELAFIDHGSWLEGEVGLFVVNVLEVEVLEQEGVDVDVSVDTGLDVIVEMGDFWKGRVVSSLVEISEDLEKAFEIVFGVLGVVSLWELDKGSGDGGAGKESEDAHDGKHLEKTERHCFVFKV